MLLQWNVLKLPTYCLSVQNCHHDYFAEVVSHVGIFACTMLQILKTLLCRHSFFLKMVGGDQSLYCASGSKGDDGDQQQARPDLPVFQ